MAGLDAVNWFPLVLSLKVAALATLCSIAIGLPLAYYLSKSTGNFADMLDSVLTLPVVLPPTVLGYYLLVLLGRQSPVGQFFEHYLHTTLVFTPTGAVIAALVVSVPLLIKTARSALAAIDRDLIHAARLLGRSESDIFFAVQLPLAWRGILSGVILTFARALGDFGTTLMVSGNIPNKTMTMPIAIYDALLAGNTALANTLVVIMTTVALAVLFALNRLEKNGLRR